MPQNKSKTIQNDRKNRNTSNTTKQHKQKAISKNKNTKKIEINQKQNQKPTNKIEKSRKSGIQAVQLLLKNALPQNVTICMQNAENQSWLAKAITYDQTKPPSCFSVCVFHVIPVNLPCGNMPFCSVIKVPKIRAYHGQGPNESLLPKITLKYFRTAPPCLENKNEKSRKSKSVLFDYL